MPQFNSIVLTLELFKWITFSLNSQFIDTNKTCDIQMIEHDKICVTVLRVITFSVFVLPYHRKKNDIDQIMNIIQI